MESQTGIGLAVSFAVTKLLEINEAMHNVQGAQGKSMDMEGSDDGTFQSKFT